MTRTKTMPDRSVENFSSSASGREGGELDEELVLKQCVKTQWGALLNPIEDAWYLENQFITFSSLSPFSSEGFITRLKIVLAYRIVRNAYDTILNDFYRMRELLTFLNSKGCLIDVITKEYLVWWRAALVLENREWVLGACRGFLIESRTFLTYPLLTEEAVTFLEQITLPGNPKGVRVNSNTQGRLTLAEREMFETRVRQAYECNRLNSAELLTLILFNSFGLRLIDYCGLKVKDVHIKNAGGCISMATIDIPVGKSGEAPRSKMSLGNQLDEDVALLFSSYIEHKPSEAPLFNDPFSKSPKQTGILAGHMSTSTAAIYFGRIVEKLHLSFNLNSYRFRYTVGTEAYRETGNPYVAAALLRHSDIQNVRVYVNEIVLAQAHDRVVASLFGDITGLLAAAMQAKTFSGIIISEQNYNDEKVIAVRAREQVGNFKPIGGCAGKPGCAQGMPVACYCCRKFRPIREADHFAMLCATLKAYFAALEHDEKQSASLVSAILGMAQVCYLTGQGMKNITEKQP